MFEDFKFSVFLFGERSTIFVWCFIVENAERWSQNGEKFKITGGTQFSPCVLPFSNQKKRGSQSARFIGIKLDHLPLR